MAAYFSCIIIDPSLKLWITQDLVSELLADHRPGVSEIHSSIRPVWQLVLLNVCSSGIYLIYWYYKNWIDLQRLTGVKVNAILRSAALLVPILNVFMLYLQLRAIQKLGRDSGVSTYRSPLIMACAYVFFYTLIVSVRVQGIIYGQSESLNDLLLTNASILLFTLLATWIIVLAQDTLNSVWSIRQAAAPISVRLSFAQMVFVAASTFYTILLGCAPLIIAAAMKSY